MAQKFVFPKVDIEKPKRSKRNLDKFIVGSVNAGSIYPVLCMDVLPTDKITIQTNARIESLPMIAPIIGRWKASFDYYFEPFSNLYSFMDNNTRFSTQSIIEMDRWNISLKNSSVVINREDDFQLLSPFSERGSLNEWLGIPINSLGAPVLAGNTLQYSNFSVPAERWFTYLDIVRNYYVNNQQENAQYVNEYNSADGSRHLMTNISLSKLDELFVYLRSNKPTQFASNDLANILSTDPLYSFGQIFTSGRKTASGFFTRTYRFDLLRGIMNSSVGVYKSAVNTNNGSFSIDTLRFASKLQKLIDRIDITGGRFSDWIRTRWSAPIPKDVDRPIYLGSHSSWIDTTDVVATASGNAGTSNNPTSVLGQQAGFAIGNVSSQRPIHLHSNEYGVLMCCFSLVPDVIYSQGFELDMLKTKFADIYDPAFKQLGYQTVSAYELCAVPSWNFADDGDPILVNTNPTASVGKRIAWSEYMASLPRAYGHFAYGQSMDYWVNGRSYIKQSSNGSYSFDPSTYINPSDWNFIFADTTMAAENFRLKVQFSIDADRPIGKRLMPHL